MAVPLPPRDRRLCCGPCCAPCPTALATSVGPQACHLLMLLSALCASQRLPLGSYSITEINPRVAHCVASTSDAYVPEADYGSP